MLSNMMVWGEGGGQRKGGKGTEAGIGFRFWFQAVVLGCKRSIA